MASFGENLRREREMRGVSLEEISAASKISLRFLHALETDQFSILPGGVFTRSFIRAYAKYLGLDEEPVLADYQLTAPPEPDVDLKRITPAKAVSPHAGSKAALWVVGVAAAMLAGSYLLYRFSQRGADVSGKGASPAGASAAPVPTSGDSQQLSGLGATGKETATTPASDTPTRSTAANSPAASVSARKPLFGDSDLSLQIAATEQAWVAVDADGRTSFQRVLNPREVQTVKAKESFDVVTGNARGIILTLNGETLKPLGEHKAYKKVHLTRDDLKNPAP